MSDSALDKAAFQESVRRERRLVDKFEFLVRYCEGRRVLDVGCVGQNTDEGDPRWLHGLIAKRAASLVGVDVEPDGIERLRARGFDVVQPGDLERSDAAFDVIVMSDVIEHVDDPIAFLSFYARFLGDGGRLVITTPNPFGAIHWLRILRGNMVKVNPEHTVWIDPVTFAEIACRARLEVDDFAWTRDYIDHKQLGLASRAMHIVAALMMAARRYFSPNYLVVVHRSE